MTLKFINLSYSILFILALSSLNVYSIILSGWSSGTKYAYLGGLRSASQMISYEVSIGLIILPIAYINSSLRVADFVTTQAFVFQLIWFMSPIFVIMFISLLAETNRAPFDLPEAEAELVAGYNVEYSSTAFALFFLAEYSNMLLASTLLILLFFGYGIFTTKIITIAFLFVVVRATYPRYRYNQLMGIGWQVFLPLTLAFFIVVVSTI